MAAGFIKIMAIDGTFTIDIRGRPKSRAQATVFRNICSSYIQAIDSKFILDEVFFSDIAFIFTWSGIPQRFQDSQLLLKFLDVKIGQYMLAWQVTFNLNLVESED